MTRPSRGGRRRRWRLAILVLVLAACSSTPTASPDPVPPSATPTRSPSTSGPPPTLGPTPALATALRRAVDADAILADLRRLEGITRENGGTRAAGSTGYDAAAAFVADELRALGYVVTLQELVVPLFRDAGPGVLAIDGADAPTLTGGTDFKAVLFSPSGDVTAPVFSLAFDVAARPGSTRGLGCDPADWIGFPRGSIALTQPGRCGARTVLDQAQIAGAVGLVRSYPGWTADRVLRPTLLDPEGVRIPVVGATHDAGIALHAAAAEGRTVRLVTQTTIVERADASVLAETPGGDAGSVVMLGAHLDGVIDGPGINDNGSGTMTLLEIARRLAERAGDPGLAAAPKVRFAFWAAEEIGLWGSSGYVAGLGAGELAAIEAYLNFDMLGSPNGVRQVYEPGITAVAGSAVIEELFGRAFEVEGLAWEHTPGGASDDVPFAQARIPTGGLFAGHNSDKTPAQVEAFGGTVGENLDPCYHLPCDTVDNVDPVLLGQMARAAAWVAGFLASGEVVLAPDR